MPDSIQGTAADGMKMWLPKLARAIAEMPPGVAYILLSVHDEIVLECKADWVERVVAVCVSALDGIIPVRLPAEVYVGPNWADMSRI